ncbi:MAG: hypothetical protein ACK56I_14875, partial [bacterium]
HYEAGAVAVKERQGCRDRARQRDNDKGRSESERSDSSCWRCRLLRYYSQKDLQLHRSLEMSHLVQH